MKDRRRVSTVLAWGLLLGMAFALAGPGTANAQEPAGSVRCPPVESHEHRLLMQQWALDAGCRRPVRTRVFDRFLGFTCLESTPGDSKCRAYAPGPASRDFDTAKHFRCIDVDLTIAEDGVIVTQLREWAAPKPQQCDYADVDILTAEVNFASAQVCIGALCMPIERLSALGKLRLRQSIERAFRDLGLVAQGGGAQASLKTGRMRFALPAR